MTSGSAASPMQGIRDVQLQIRRNAEEYRSYVSELAEWGDSMKQTSAAGSAAAAKSAPPPRQPIRGTAGGAGVKKNASQMTAGDTGSNGQPAAAAAPRDYKSWDKLDVDQMLQAMDNEDNEEYHRARLASERQAAGEEDAAAAGPPPPSNAAELADIEKDTGNVFFKKGKYAKAAACYSRALALQPTHTVALVNRAMAHLKLEDFAAAERDCDAALALDARHVKALWRRAAARKGQGNKQGAIADLERARVLDPTNAEVKDELAVLSPPPPATTAETNGNHLDDSVIVLSKNEARNLREAVKAGGVRRRRKLEIREIESGRGDGGAADAGGNAPDFSQQQAQPVEEKTSSIAGDAQEKKAKKSNQNHPAGGVSLPDIQSISLGETLDPAELRAVTTKPVAKAPPEEGCDALPPEMRPRRTPADVVAVPCAAQQQTRRTPSPTKGDNEQQQRPGSRASIEVVSSNPSPSKEQPQPDSAAASTAEAAAATRIASVARPASGTSRSSTPSSLQLQQPPLLDPVTGALRLSPPCAAFEFDRDIKVLREHGELPDPSVAPGPSAPAGESGPSSVPGAAARAYLRAIAPRQLPQLFRTAIDAQQLGTVLRLLHAFEVVNEKDKELGPHQLAAPALYNYLYYLSQCPRFAISATLLDAGERAQVRDLVARVEDAFRGNAAAMDKVARMRQPYDRARATSE